MGFVLGGSTPTKVLIRGIGPTLGAFGVPGTVVDPQLALFNSSSAKLGENHDWGGTAELTAAFFGRRLRASLRLQRRRAPRHALARSLFRRSLRREQYDRRRPRRSLRGALRCFCLPGLRRLRAGLLSSHVNHARSSLRRRPAASVRSVATAQSRARDGYRSGKRNGRRASGMATGFGSGAHQNLG